VSVNPCYAERRNDDGNDGTRDDSLWSETESRDSSRSGKSKCGISERADKIRIDSKKGKGGSAAYESKWLMDWTDSFVIEFEHELKSGRPKKTSQSATSGIALGFGLLNPASGFPDGVNVVVSQTKAARTLTATVRVAGAVVKTEKVNIGSGAHDFKLVWTSVGGAVSLDVQRGVSTTTLVSLTGLEDRFYGYEDEGMGVSLFGTSSGNFKFEASFDNFSCSGDDQDDLNDDGFDDDDDGFDDDDEDGDRDDADEDGDSNGDDSAEATRFNFALGAIIDYSDLPLLEAEFDVEEGSLVVKALQWDAPAGQLVKVVAFATTGTIRGLPLRWTPNASQRDKYADSISVSNSVVLSAQNAVLQALDSNPGATVHAIELEEESDAPVWEVEIVTASGVRKVPISAN
jgi:uncharacterized membrane protein YkoI